MDCEKFDSENPKAAAADVFQRVVRESNISCVELLDLGNQRCSSKAVHDTARQTKLVIRPKSFGPKDGDGQTHACCC